MPARLHFEFPKSTVKTRRYGRIEGPKTSCRSVSRYWMSPVGPHGTTLPMRSVLAFLALTALLGASSLTVSQAAEVADLATPANVTSCRVVPAAIARRGTSTQEVIRVSFSVERDVAADLARFTVSSPNGTFRDFTARGRFSHGTVIADRVLRADPSSEQQFYSLGAGTGAECSLTYLHFVDGSSWTPAPPVRVAACNVIPDAVGQRGSVQELIRVTFTLERGPPADLARFTLKTRYGDYPGFTARGSLSGGAAIADRVVIADPEAQRQFFALDSTLGCDVSHVHFIDGTSWNAPAPASFGDAAP